MEWVGVTLSGDKREYVVRRTGDWWLGRYSVVHPNGGVIGYAMTVLGARWMIRCNRRRNEVVYREPA